MCAAFVLATIELKNGIIFYIRKSFYAVAEKSRRGASSIFSHGWRGALQNVFKHEMLI